MKRIFVITLSLISYSTQYLTGQTITWSSDAAKIIYTKCTNCHRTGGIAPFTLESYQESLDNSSSIKRVVNSGAMPPWPPDPNYSVFAHTRSLSNTQKANLINWIDNGMPRGDILKEPSLPIYPNNGDLAGTPDASHMAPLFSIKAPNDIYQCFVIKNKETVDRFINAMEVVPGNRNAVHHVLVYYDNTGQAKKLDDASLEPGYASFGGIGVNSAELIGAWVPGSVPTQYPKGMGVKLPAGGDIVVQIHYPKDADGQMDQTLLKLFYSKESKTRQVFISPILDHLGTLTNGPLIIPANTIKTFNAEYTVNNLKATLLSVAPHMHLIGKSIEVYSLSPSNIKTNLIKINNWDFHWQGSYSFPKPIILNPGSKLMSHATYDNTSNNRNNPNSPPKLVTLGEKTTDEMMLVYFTFLLYQAGDENIIIDSSFINQTKDISEHKDLWNVSQLNSNEILISIEDSKWNNSILSIYNSNGQIIQNIKINSLGMHKLQVSNSYSGLIYVSLRNNSLTATKKLMLKE